jgi:FkbM family methyltransferase
MVKEFLKKIKLIRLLLYKFNKSYMIFKVFPQLNKKSIFIDIGANVGFVTQYITDKYNCKIYAYEPHPKAYSYLKKKFINNKKIEIINKAVSNKSGTSKIYFHEKDNDEVTIKYSEATSLDKNKINISVDRHKNVSLVNIKELINSFDFIDCIKIDIEGHEYLILDDLINNKKKIGKVICELHGNYNDSKNINYRKKYIETINLLKKNNLLNSWFIEWI